MLFKYFHPMCTSCFKHSKLWFSVYCKLIFTCSVHFANKLLEKGRHCKEIQIAGRRLMRLICFDRSADQLRWINQCIELFTGFSNSVLFRPTNCEFSFLYSAFTDKVAERRCKRDQMRNAPGRQMHAYTRRTNFALSHFHRHHFSLSSDLVHLTRYAHLARGRSPKLQ